MEIGAISFENVPSQQKFLTLEYTLEVYIDMQNMYIDCHVHFLTRR